MMTPLGKITANAVHIQKACAIAAFFVSPAACVVVVAAYAAFGVLRSIVKG